jgi:hypothetical protein
VRTTALLLRDGLRLSLLRTPRHVATTAGFLPWFLIALLGLLLDAGWHWFLVEAPRLPNGFGVQTALAAAMLRLAVAALLGALTERRGIFWCIAAWLEGAALLPALVAGTLLVLDRGSELPLHWAGWILGMAWTLLVLLRLAAWLRPGFVARALGAALAGFVLLAGPWFWLDAQLLWQTDWQAWAERQEGYDPDAPEPGSLDAPEATIYAQPERLAAALDALDPQREDRIDLFALAVGGDASEDVFRNEVDYVAKLMPQRFDAAGRTLALLNHPQRSDTLPLATATNLERVLLGLGERMDRDEDILFLYLTSHGSEDHEFYLNQPPLPLDQLDPARLRAALDASGIRWRVVVVSACYSGGFIEALRDPHTLVLTAARADRTSFGCGVDSDITWFGKAFLAQALNETTDFIAAHGRARTSIEAWEKAEEITASDPQIDAGAEIAAHLERWRSEFEPGPALPFDPPTRTRDSAAAR